MEEAEQAFADEITAFAEEMRAAADAIPAVTAEPEIVDDGTSSAKVRFTLGRVSWAASFDMCRVWSPKHARRASQ